MLNTCIASTDYDLTTTGFVKQLLGWSATATSTVQDARLSALIRAASRWAESYVGYPISVQTYQEALPSYDRRLLIVNRTPVRAVKRLLDATDSGSAAQAHTSEFRVEDRDAGFLSRDEGWFWSVVAEGDLTPRPAVGQEYKPWLADYVAGWTIGGLTTDSPHWSTEAGSTSTGRTLPEDIELAVAMKVTRSYQNPDNIVREHLGDLRVDYYTETAGIDPPEERILNYYQRVK